MTCKVPVEEVVVGGGAIEVAVDLDKLVAGHIARHVQWTSSFVN